MAPRANPKPARHPRQANATIAPANPRTAMVRVSLEAVRSKMSGSIAISVIAGVAHQLANYLEEAGSRAED